MTKPNYTPAPWKHDDGHIFTDLKGREYNSIATVHEIYDNNGKPETNNQLITAAPDLADALANMVLYYVNQKSLSDMELADMHTQAEQALIKAGYTL